MVWSRRQYRCPRRWRGPPRATSYCRLCQLRMHIQTTRRPSASRRRGPPVSVGALLFGLPGSGDSRSLPLPPTHHFGTLDSSLIPSSQGRSGLGIAYAQLNSNARVPKRNDSKLQPTEISRACARRAKVLPHADATVYYCRYNRSRTSLEDADCNFQLHCKLLLHELSVSAWETDTFTRRTCCAWSRFCFALRSAYQNLPHARSSLQTRIQ